MELWDAPPNTLGRPTHPKKGLIIHYLVGDHLGEYLKIRNPILRINISSIKSSLSCGYGTTP